MGALDETILRASKEIMVKFIEMGINETVRSEPKESPEPASKAAAPKKKR